jgi:hypothetical protein
LPKGVLSDAEINFNLEYPHLIDTSCYALRTTLYVETAPLWYAGYGADCIVGTWLVQNHAVATIGRATVNYPLTSAASPPVEWFIDGNRLMSDLYGSQLPWRSPDLRAHQGPRAHPHPTAGAANE